MKRSNLRPIWSMFTVFLSLFILNFAVSIPLGGTQRMWLLLELWSLLLSGALLTRYGLPDRKKRVLSASLALLACLGHALVYKAPLSAIWSFLLTLTAALAVFSTFSHFAEQEIPLLRVGKGSECALSVGVGLAVGALLGAVNLFLGGGRSAQGFHPVVPALLVALNPAIMEEVALRTVFFAFCLHLMQGQCATKSQRFTGLFMMVVPHVLIHTPEAFMQGGMIGGLVSTLIYVVLFGLPFAILQRRRDLASAMIAHGTVDLIRFCLLGLPL